MSTIVNVEQVKMYHDVPSMVSLMCYQLFCKVEPVLTDHCHERPPVLKDQILLTEGPTFQCN